MFLGLNEAVVSEITKRHLHEILENDPETRAEWQWIKSQKAERVKNNIAREEKVPSDEVYWIGRDGEDYRIKTHPYFVHRKVLNFLVDTIAEDMGKSSDEVMKLFFNAHFNGHLLEIGRMVNRSFGKDLFRVVAMMDNKTNSAWQVFEYLQKQRRLKKSRLIKASDMI